MPLYPRLMSHVDSCYRVAVSGLGGAVHRGQNVCRHVGFLKGFRIHAIPGCALRVLVIGYWPRDMYGALF